MCTNITSSKPMAKESSTMAEDDYQTKKPHVALLLSSGMGHFNPFMRLATLLASSRNCRVTLIASTPTVSAAESDNLSEFFAECTRHRDLQDIHYREFQLPNDYLHFQSSTSSDDFSGIGDPVFRQFKVIRSSVHLMLPLLASLSPPLSCIFTDFALVGGISGIVDALCVPFYVVSVTCAKFFSVMACLPHLKLDPKNDIIELPGLFSLPATNLPLPILNSSSFFASDIMANSPFLYKAKGIIFNTFLELEPETIAAINNSEGGGRVLPNIPPFLPVGPFHYPTNFGKAEGAASRPYPSSWLDDQPPASVLYVSFGSRTAMSKEQIRELGLGLERSGCRFLWVLKTSVVDKDENKEEIQELVGEKFLEATKEKGLVIKEWVKQEEILAHPAISGFLSHAGWNSVTEAVKLGVPLLAWPLMGDHRVNADVAEKAKIGMCMKHWSFWEKNLVKGEEIAESIMEFLQDKALMAGAKRVMQEAKRARETGGSSDMVLREIIQSLKS